MNKSFVIGTITVGAALSLGGCDVAENALNEAFGAESEQAEQAAASLDATVLEASLLASLIDGSDTEGDGQARAESVVALAEQRFTPAECLQAEAAGGAAAFTFTDCAGPRGLTGISGIATVTFNTPQDGQVQLTATDLELNGATMTITVFGEYPAEEEGISVNTAGAGTDEEGTLISRAGDYSFSWDESCITMTGGIWSSTISSETILATGINGSPTICPPGCPSSGQLLFSVSETADLTGNPLSDAIAIAFDGDDSAPFVGTDGTPGIATLSCASGE